MVKSMALSQDNCSAHVRPQAVHPYIAAQTSMTYSVQTSHAFGKGASIMPATSIVTPTTSSVSTPSFEEVTSACFNVQATAPRVVQAGMIHTPDLRLRSHSHHESDVAIPLMQPSARLVMLRSHGWHERDVPNSLAQPITPRMMHASIAHTPGLRLCSHSQHESDVAIPLVQLVASPTAQTTMTQPGPSKDLPLGCHSRPNSVGEIWDDPGTKRLHDGNMEEECDTTSQFLPEIDDEIASGQHPLTCKPCAFYNRPGGCLKGSTCDRCHHPDHTETRYRNRKARQAARMSRYMIEKERRL